MSKIKYTTQDLHSIAEFNRIVMNYLKMTRLGKKYQKLSKRDHEKY